MTLSVKKSELTDLVEIKSGGFGIVYRTTYRLRGDPSPLAYKEFTSGVAEQVASAERAIQFREGMSASDRGDLDQYSAWPRALVEDRGHACGLLMPLLGDEFFCELTNEDGDRVRNPRGLQWLIAGPVQFQAAGMTMRDLDRTERLVLLGQLVYIFARLHKLDWVFGDLSATNAVFATDPLRLMLIDCDAAAPRSDQNRKQSSSLNWDPPECPISGPRRQKLLDAGTDVYKLGLALARCLNPNMRASSLRSAALITGLGLEPKLEDAAVRALSDDRALRPTAKELYQAMRGVLAVLVSPPKIHVAHLRRRILMRGQDARVEWQVENADQLVLVVGGNRLTVNPKQHPTGYTWRADQSGPVSIEVTNKFGTAIADLDYLDLFEVPDLDLDLDGMLPVLQVPTLPTVPMDSLAMAMTGRPVVTPGAIDLPQVTLPAVGEFVQATSPQGAVVPGGPRLHDAVAQANGALHDLLTAETDALIKKIRKQLASITT